MDQVYFIQVVEDHPRIMPLKFTCMYLAQWYGMWEVMSFNVIVDGRELKTPMLLYSRSKYHKLSNKINNITSKANKSR